jgi:hypothetical protein
VTLPKGCVTAAYRFPLMNRAFVFKVEVLLSLILFKVSGTDINS